MDLILQLHEEAPTKLGLGLAKQGMAKMVPLPLRQMLLLGLFLEKE